MKRTSSVVLAVLCLVSLAGCASHRTTVRIPPRIDLKQHETIGIVEFSSSAEGELGTLATRRFTESARRDQGLVRMVTFGPETETLRSVGASRWDPDAYRALGQEHDVRTILVGELTVSEVRPDIRVSPSLRSGSLTAQVDATLEVQLIETSTGASIWSRSARATQSVGHISVLGGRGFVFDADDPERAYGGLVETLVAQVSRDFQVTWERR